MKILNKYFLAGLIIAIALPFCSCKKSFLDIQPKGYLIATNAQDYEQLLDATFFSSSFTASTYLGDEMAAQQTYYDAAQLRARRLFEYQDRVYNSDEIPLELNGTNTYMQNLYIYNKIINEVMSSNNGTDQYKRGLLAQAKAGRAICNLMFQADFAMPYDPATASTDLGIPLITVADVTQTKFVRATNQQTFDAIIKDLTDAIPDLDILVHRRKISKLCAEFYLARAYLYMQNFTAARTQIDNAFLEVPKANIPLALYDYNVVLDTDPNAQGTWYPDFGFGPSGKPLAAVYTENIYDVTSSSFFFPAANTFVFSPQTAALFDPADFRLNLYSNTELFGSFVFPKGMRRYPGFTTEIGAQLSDLYLMRAELEARADDLAGAKTDLELLRIKRLPPNTYQVPANAMASQQALVNFIFDERIREFATSGLRWLDMRRLSVDKAYSSNVKYTHSIYDDNGNVVSTFTLKPQRFALKFGDDVIAKDQGLIENP